VGTLIWLSLFQEFTQVGYRESKQLLRDVSLTVAKVRLVNAVW